MGVKVTNNAFGTLSAAINTSTTTITLDSGQGARFPTLGAGDFFYGTIVDTGNNIEIVKVTARSSDSLTVVRGQDDTTATAFAIGDRFELRPTAALFEDVASLANDDSPQLGADLDTNSNNINFADSDKAQFGASNDLQIYHDGSNSYITDEGTGDLYIRGGPNVRITDTSNNKMALFQDGGEAQLYYNGSEKLATTNDGVDITGTLSNGSGASFRPTYAGSVTTSDNNYKLFARVSGGSGFDSSCEFSLSGTTGNTVAGCVGVAMANHSADGSITTWVDSNYSGMKVKLVSDGNNNFELYVAVSTYSTNNITVTYRVRPINGTVTPAPASASYSTCHLIHTTGDNTNTSSSGMSSGVGSTAY